jgi:hypothetical protein
MTASFATADRFLLTSARLLERRRFAARFLGQPADLVTDALRGYQNADGGFGHALEPDTRCPASLPVYTEQAFQALAEAGAAGDDLATMAGRACDHLAGVAAAAAAGGAVPLALPVIEAFPRAAHWSEWTYVPALNPTAGLTGLLYRLGIEHPWREEAAAWCWRQLDSGAAVGDAHTLSEVMVFLEHVPDQDRAARHAAELAGRLAGIEMLQLDPGAAGYGLTPLQLAPEAGSRWRSLFTEDQLSGFLDRLESEQEADGGWPIRWDPPEGAGRLEWRGIVTLAALRTLVSYGRLTAAT